MKPIVIIAISVGCSVGAILGIAVALDYGSDMAAQKLQEDGQKAYKIQQEYSEITSEHCNQYPPPRTYTEAELVMKDAERVLRTYASDQDRMIELGKQMQVYADKYPEYDIFVLQKASCPYEYEWEKEIEKNRSAMAQYREQLEQQKEEIGKDLEEFCIDGNCYYFSKP